MKKRMCGVFLLLALSLPLSMAHDESGQAIGNDAYDPLGEWKVFGFGVAIIAIFSVIAICYGDNLSEPRKKLLFALLAIGVAATSIYFIATTLSLNLASHTKGPVHWHADYEIYRCGEQINLVDPQGLSNKIGSSLFHEHNDDRIHVEGPILDPRQVDLANFFEVSGGMLSPNSLRIPTNEGPISMASGQICDGVPAKLQVFVMKVENPKDRGEWIYSQAKLEDPMEYVLSPQSQVPPGDCIIIELAQEKKMTEHLCETYDLAIQRGELHGS